MGLGRKKTYHSQDIPLPKMSPSNQAMAESANPKIRPHKDSFDEESATKVQADSTQVHLPSCSHFWLTQK